MRAARFSGLIAVLAVSLAATGRCLGQAGNLESSTPAASRTPTSLVIGAETAATLAARSPVDVEDLRRIQEQLQRVLGRALPATASVEIGRAAGSGVVVSADGLVLTAAHVVGEPGREAWIELPDGRRMRGTTLGADHGADAGMVRIDAPPRDLPFAPISEGAPLAAGEWVVTTGQPGGLVAGRTPPVRLGRVLFRDGDLLCTDCKLVGGDSGGPLFNMRGEVVGIHSSIGPSLTHNFHVPVTAFRRDWDRLLANELWGGDYEELNRNRAMLGVRGESAGGRCVLTVVFDGMPVARAGIRVGDVIASVNSQKITTFDQLKDIVAFKKPGEWLTLAIERAGDNLELRVQLSRPDGTVPPERRPPYDE